MNFCYKFGKKNHCYKVGYHLKSLHIKKMQKNNENVRKT